MRRKESTASAWSARAWITLPAVCAAVGACGPEDATFVEAPAPEPGPPWFEEVSGAAGVEFAASSGHVERYLMPEIMVGGVALTDVENDGDLDLYLVQAGSVTARAGENPPNELYSNDGTGRFTNVTAASGAGDRGYGMGVACGDYDNDGYTDVYVTNVGPNALFRNGGDGTFEDVRGPAGVDDAGWGSSCAFLDYDRDGWLDLYVCNYLDWSEETELDCYNGMGGVDYCSPKNYYAPSVDVLYRNERAQGVFANATEAAGLTSSYGTGLGVVAADFDGDGWPDVFVANDGMPDQLWINGRDGTFVDRGLVAGCALDDEGLPKAGMGVTVSDVDFDGDPDLLVCNLGGESDSYYLNEGGSFSDATAQLGLRAASRRLTRFGVGWLDFDNDGYVDLYEANGRVEGKAHTFADDPYAEPNFLFTGAADGSFREVFPQGGTRDSLIATSRGAAFGDIDDDGGVDVVVVNRDAGLYVLRNIAPERGNWIAFRVLDENGRDALNATITMQVGGRTIVRDVRAAYSYQASSDPRVHVGLGGAREVEDVRVTWVDGAVTPFGDHEAGSVVELRRPAR